MFKPGQLVRNTNTGLLYVVEGYDQTGIYVLVQTIEPPIYRPVARAIWLELIGNNYRPKKLR